MALLTLQTDLFGADPRFRDALAGVWRRICAWVFAVTGSAAAANAAGISTEDLILRFQRGQPAVFEILYDRYKDYVYRVAYIVLRHEQEAEDAVQETFLDVLRALPDYDVQGPARFETWLYRVTVNRAKMRLRRSSSSGRHIASEEWDDLEEGLERLPSPDTERPEREVIDREQAQALWRAVDQLPDTHRLPVMLRYRESLSYEEIAQVLGIGLGTVKSRLFNAHKKLLELMQQERR